MNKYNNQIPEEEMNEQFLNQIFENEEEEIVFENNNFDLGPIHTDIFNAEQEEIHDNTNYENKNNKENINENKLLRNNSSIQENIRRSNTSLQPN